MIELWRGRFDLRIDRSPDRCVESQQILPIVFTFVLWDEALREGFGGSLCMRNLHHTAHLNNGKKICHVSGCLSKLSMIAVRAKECELEDTFGMKRWFGRCRDSKSQLLMRRKVSSTAK